ncbi:5-hydroxytryptamine receptor 5B-like [Mizuhopecten yessoensis]|uniref:5-hydroxytryptamine receptor 2A n=1 Tax=Mizuhopecten yessoensis TaxID=6573 RepID=A0A210QZ41_MIZYE|nr:5-hydroxytryptamine receptor 5B-like [Mizuhopecten yessoensis]OWF54014.1 5-hydroxytryptamine receptor 2A [Mizuhopecten yessoensis]
MTSHNSSASYSYMYYDDQEYNQTLLELLQQHEKESPRAFIFAVLMTILSAIFNTGITIAILFTPTLRQNILYIQIINISVVNIILSGFVIPLAIYAEHRPWTLGDAMCKVWIIMDVLMPFVSMVSLVLMNLDRLFVLICNNSHMLTMNSMVKVFLVLVPWSVGCVIVLPIWILGSNHYPYYDGYCIFGLVFDASVASPIITYFVPAVGIILLITLILMYNFKGNLAEQNMYSSPSRSIDCHHRTDSTSSYDEEKYLSLVTLCLADFFFIAMWFPYQLFTLLMSICTGCYPPVSAAVAFTWLGASTACVLPLTWLSDVKIRESIRTFLHDRCTQEVSDLRERNSVPLMEL